MRESNYWLRMIKALNEFEGQKDGELGELISESTELKNILGKIASSTRININNYRN